MAYHATRRYHFTAGDVLAILAMCWRSSKFMLHTAPSYMRSTIRLQLGRHLRSRPSLARNCSTRVSRNRLCQFDSTTTKESPAHRTGQVSVSSLRSLDDTAYDRRPRPKRRQWQVLAFRTHPWNTAIRQEYRHPCEFGTHCVPRGAWVSLMRVIHSRSLRGHVWC